MTCLEALTRDTLTYFDKYKTYDKIIAAIKDNVNYKFADIDAEKIYEICQYFYYERAMKFSNAEAKFKNGDIVELRNGERFLLMDDRIINENSHEDFSDAYNEDLIHYCNDDFDIMKIYKPNKPYRSQFIFENRFLTLIWERKE